MRPVGEDVVVSSIRAMFRLSPMPQDGTRKVRQILTFARHFV